MAVGFPGGRVRASAGIFLRSGGKFSIFPVQHNIQTPTLYFGSEIIVSH
jgi:hypothetical protein